MLVGIYVYYLPENPTYNTCFMYKYIYFHRTHTILTCIASITAHIWRKKSQYMLGLCYKSPPPFGTFIKIHWTVMLYIYRGYEAMCVCCRKCITHYTFPILIYTNVHCVKNFPKRFTPHYILTTLSCYT